MKPKRPPGRNPAVPQDLQAVSERCSYEGSREHKDRRSWLWIAAGAEEAGRHRNHMPDGHG